MPRLGTHQRIRRPRTRIPTTLRFHPSEDLLTLIHAVSDDPASECATALKRRYATREAACREARILAFVAEGQVMRTYLCGCGWWHLTRRGAQPLPAEAVA